MCSADALEAVAAVHQSLRLHAQALDPPPTLRREGESIPQLKEARTYIHTFVCTKQQVLQSVLSAPCTPV